MQKYVNKQFPKVEVEFVGEAELRRGESKEKVVVYRRDERLYVRGNKEFDRMFQEVKK